MGLWLQRTNKASSLLCMAFPGRRHDAAGMRFRRFHALLPLLFAGP
jgi:hypothetical protein